MRSTQKPQRKPLLARETIRSVVTDEDFKPNVEQLGGNRQRAFATTAMTLVELGTSESGHRSRTVDQLHVAATLDEYVTAKTRFDTSDFHPSEKSDIKDSMIAFNHALSRLIDNDPSANYNEVLSYLKELYRTLRPRETAERYEYVESKFADTLKGMTHEIIAEQLMGYLGYEVDGDITAADEKRGIDRFVIIGDRREGVDIKASGKKANEARSYDTRGRYILATNVPDDVIGCSFRLGQQDIPRYATLFQKEIDHEQERVERTRKRPREHLIPA